MTEPRAKISSDNRSPAREYCEVCKHRVYGLDKHALTEEHKRNLKRREEGEDSSGGVLGFTGREMELLMYLVDSLNHDDAALCLKVSNAEVVRLKSSIRQKLHID